MELSKALPAGSDSSQVTSSVMGEYFKMFSCQEFQEHFGEHSVVDWFGRRVRGVGRIQSFLKYEVWSQYEQKTLTDPEECEPFEANPIHFQTQKPLEKNRKKTDRISRLNLLGILPLKRKPDSDIESEDDMRANSGYKTPERSIVPLETAGNLTPPPSSNKNDLDMISIETDSEIDLEATEADEEKRNDFKQCLKRSRSRSRSRSFHYLQHFPRKMRKHNNYSVTKTFNDSDDDFVSLESSSDEEPERESPKEIEYTPLKYIRVTGMLEAKTSLYVSSNSFKHTDSPIRISLSYRRHLKTNSIQIALVLYEKLDDNGQVIGNNRLLKRKLFDFGDNADKVNQEDEDNVNEDDDDETKETTKFFNLETSNDASQEITSITNEITLAELPNQRRDSSLPFEDDEEAISSSSTLVNVSERSSDTASLTSIEADTDSLTAINPVTDSLAWLNPFNSTNPMNISSAFNTTPAPSSPSTTNLMMDSIDSTNLNNVTSSLRTPSKTNGPPSTPKRKSKAPKSVPISVLKRLQESSISLKPPPKSTAARCLRL